MKNVIYPAVFSFDKDSNSYVVDFIDLKGCSTEGRTIEEAYLMAQDAMGLYLCDLTNSELPESTVPFNKTKLSNNEFIALISLDLDEYRKRHNNAAIKKTLTIPEWLNKIAEKNDINFSQVLQDALKTKLNIK